MANEPNKTLNTYTPLRVRSNHSYGAGASPLEDLLRRAAGHGIASLALTDENNLCGAVPFFTLARDYGIRPILGALLDDGRYRALLLVRDGDGYGNLCDLLTRRALDGDAFVLTEALPPRQDGLFILVDNPHLLEYFATRVALPYLWAEVARPARDLHTETRLIRTAQRLGVGVAASADVFYAHPRAHDLHVVLRAMHARTTVDAIARRSDELWPAPDAGALRTPRQMARMFADLPEALEATDHIARQCRFDLLNRPTVFPKQGSDAPERLRAEAEAGLRRRFGQDVKPQHHARLEHELGLIIRKGFADYFLVVQEIVAHARSLGTPVAGRGSGASSLVAYVLGITNVDPLAYQLPFERFLNEARQDFPDLDIDFCWRLRDEVIDHVYRKYGDDHVAMIATYATLQPRLGFREVGRALGLADDVITQIMRKLHGGLPRERWNTLPAPAQTVKRIVQLARRMEGFPHHLSVHCGGVVLTPDPVWRHAPLVRAQKGVVITQYDKDGVEAVGLVKLDLLGNRALSSAAEGFRLVNEGRVPEAPPLDPEHLPDGDPATVELLQSANTIGVNQLESPAMRHLLRQLRPYNVRRVMQTLALIRPGAAGLGMKEVFVRRARGLEPPAPIDPRLDHLLTETYGIMVYEDDALHIAQALTGLSPAEADRFRRAITKCRSDDVREQLSAQFLGHCEQNDVDMEIARDLWTQMAKFNSYSFCRAHSASYARLAWANAYMKAHHPAEFWVGALNNNQGIYSRWVYLEEARRLGINTLLPCVNHSEEEFTLQSGAIRTGLQMVRGLTERTLDAILQNRPFSDPLDLVARTPARLEEVENLIRAGAFDFVDATRPALVLALHTGYESAKRLRKRGATLFPITPTQRPLPDLDDYDPRQRWADEWSILGISPRCHPMTWLRAGLRARGVVRSDMMLQRIGKHLRVAGLPATRRTNRTSKGDLMAFITLSDEDSLFDVTVFPGVLERHRQLLADDSVQPLVVDGVVEDKYDAVTITGARIRAPADAKNTKRAPRRH